MTINEFNFAGKKAIVRVDFNVPLDENGNITDDTRIRGALPTLKKILADGGAAIIMSHMGKPKGKVNPKLSLGQIREAVEKTLGVPVAFAADCAKADAEAAALPMGQALLLENLRYYPEEEGKPVGIDKEDPAYKDAKDKMKVAQKLFAKKLASYADCYVMDAFGTAHRKHASTAVIADFFDADNKMLGLLMEKEVQAFDNVLNNIKRPFVAIMGGSKVSSKIGIIENLLGKVDRLILCGGMTYTFSKAHDGKIGNSIVELDKLDVALGVEKLAKEKGVELVLGTDCTATNGLDFGTMTVKEGAQIITCPANDVPEGFEGVDAGPESQKAFAKAIEGAKTILWNGPAGVFECDSFTAGSRAIGEAIAKATKEGAFSLIGGGDSVACVNKFGLADQVSYISTGGGALLEAIEGKTLPGVAAIKGEKEGK
ncbi:MAG: phosphoglycerate kinase [Prevotella sp.]|nr:phosphoglycerate kinase [Prevotella sp.]